MTRKPVQRPRRKPSAEKTAAGNGLNKTAFTVAPAELEELPLDVEQGLIINEASSPAKPAAKAHKTPVGAGSDGHLPSLETAVEFGDARVWGLSLARDIAEYRAGRIGWQDVDRGAVLYSEPGLGKSMFARILAKACGVPLVAYSIADLFASSPGYLDSVVKAGRAVFARAAAAAAAASAPCILFLDEIDALPSRSKMSDRDAAWWTPVITDFLLALDAAVAGQRTGIVVIGATNNIGGVDTALLRPGRLERAIFIARPDHAGVMNILRYHLDGALADEDLTLVGHLLSGSTGADIMLTVREARRLARFGGRELSIDDLVRAAIPEHEIEPEALLRISTHEAAHAVGSLAVPAGVLLRCILTGAARSPGQTIVAKETGDLATRDSIERRAVVTLCGRAAERLLIGSVSLGSGGDDDSDLAVVTRFVATLHGSTGLGGSLVYLASHDEALQAVRYDLKLRARVERHMRLLQARADQVVWEHRGAIIAVAEQLRSRRHLSGDEIRRIFEATAPTMAPARSTHH
jgi:cell division protease FtsH